VGHSGRRGGGRRNIGDQFQKLVGPIKCRNTLRLFVSISLIQVACDWFVCAFGDEFGVHTSDFNLANSHSMLCVISFLLAHIDLTANMARFISHSLDRCRTLRFQILFLNGLFG
jgi:hypothetical protein